MSVYNRKMFNRNARNKLNQSAGIAPVQKFSNGGLTRVGGSNQPALRFSQQDVNRLRALTTPPSTLERIASNLAFDRGARGYLQSLMGPKQTSAGKRALQVGLGGIGSIADVGFSAGKGLASLFTDQPNMGAGTKAAPAVLAPGTVSALNDGSQPIPEDLLGVDLMTVPGFESGTEAPPVPRGTAPGRIVKIGPEGAGTKGRPPSPFDIFKADTEMTDIDMGPDEANMQAIAMADADMTSTDMSPDEAERIRAMSSPTALGRPAGTGTETEKDTDTDTGTDKTLADSVEDMPNVEPQAASPEEVAQTLEAAPETQEDALKRLMKEFTQNAPEYQGLDKGLAMAKIGFAMAAGKSPNAIENIANAMEQGADMLIKDKQNRDAFKRQVNLSALQYGLGEVGKLRAQERADERAFTDYVVAGDKPFEYKGTTYQPGDTVSVSVKDRMENGGKLPAGLIDKAVHTANQSAIVERLKNNAKLTKEALDRKTMTPKDQREFTKEYRGYVKQASEAETAGTLIETVMLNADNIVGGGPAAKQAGANFLSFFGVKAPEGWNDQKLGVQDLKAALQSVVPATLGSTQSANSISDRDVNFLIQGFLADGVMTANGDGTFAFATTSKKAFRNSLGNGLQAVRRSQAEALAGMEGIDNQLAEMLTVGGRVGTTLVDPYRRDGFVAPGSTAREGVQINSLVQGDDGIFEINEDFFK